MIATGSDFIHLATPTTLYWVNDRSQVIIVDWKSRKSFKLNGLESIIWNWLFLGYSYQEIVMMTAQLISKPTRIAANILESIFHDWLAKSLLEIEDIV